MLKRHYRNALDEKVSPDFFFLVNYSVKAV